MTTKAVSVKDGQAQFHRGKINDRERMSFLIKGGQLICQ